MKRYSKITIKRKFQGIIIALKNPKIILVNLKYYYNRFIDDKKADIKYNYPEKIIFIAGLPLSGTTWIKNLMARIPGYYTRRMSMPFNISHNQDIIDSAFKNLPHRGYTLFKTHLNPTTNNLDCIRRNGVNKIIVNYRDLRDVVISRYYRLLEFPKSKGDTHYMDYNSISKEKGIDNCIEIIISDYVPWIRGWIKFAKFNPDICYIIKYENLKKNTKCEFIKLLDFYNINLPEDLVRNIIEASKGKNDMKNNILSSGVLPWGLSSNFRKGKIGGWKTEFTAKQINRCKEGFGQLLIDLGYEKDINW